jgi:hypothetical protein
VTACTCALAIESMTHIWIIVMICSPSYMVSCRKVKDGQARGEVEVVNVQEGGYLDRTCFFYPSRCS